MKAKDIKEVFHKELDVLFGKEEVDSFFYLLMDSYYQISRLQLAMDVDYEIDAPNAILKSLELLKQEKPIQYILGETEFYGLLFKVNEYTLIPRPETEELVAWVVSKFKGQKSEISILDIGTGTGCIAVSLAKQLQKAKVYALDVSKQALATAKINATLNGVDVEFIEADILKEEADLGVGLGNLKFDIIVSNPPYVREQEKKQMKSNVLDNEPHLALFVKDENPLLFYKAIIRFATHNLKQAGTLFFEINEYLGNDMIHLLHKNNYSYIELKQDIFKKDRMIKAVKN